MDSMYLIRFSVTIKKWPIKCRHFSDLAEYDIRESFLYLLQLTKGKIPKKTLHRLVMDDR